MMPQVAMPKQRHRSLIFLFITTRTPAFQEEPHIDDCQEAVITIRLARRTHLKNCMLHLLVKRGAAERKLLFFPFSPHLD